MDMQEPARFLTIPGAPARRIAYRKLEGRGPEIVWLGGFMSDMRSGKAEALAEWAAGEGRAFLRFDYSGHGESDGDFRDGTISQWRDDALAVIDNLTSGPPLLIGSSMGGWIALLIARLLRADDRPLAGMMLIAPASDFTEALMWPQFPEHVKRAIMEDGVWLRPSAYGEPYPITRGLIEDGRKNLILGAPFETGCPVHILQGRHDPDVPWRHAQKLAEHLPLDDVTLTLIEDGDHRLSRDQDIALLIRTVAAMAEGE